MGDGISLTFPSGPPLSVAKQVILLQTVYHGLCGRKIPSVARVSGQGCYEHEYRLPLRTP